VGKIIESTLVTLDGVTEDPANWAGAYLDESFQEGALERLLRSEAMLMGRRTYELLARDWADQRGDFADRMNAIRKYVFSATLDRAAWNNSVVIDGGVSSEVAKLKNAASGDLSVYGHGQLSQTLLRDGLIDEIRMSVFPVFVGSGKLLFREGERAALQLLEVINLPTGVVVMRYRPATQ
jgi:dihydrofolate reductase